MRKAFKQDEGTPSTLAELIQGISVHVKEDSKYVTFQKTYENDRVAFVHDCLPSYRETIAPYQEESLSLFDTGHNRIAIRGPHGLGKTFLASALVHHTILTASRDTKVPTTASAWRQLENYTWPEIHKIAKQLYWPAIGRSAYTSEELLVRAIKTRAAQSFAIASDDHTTLEGAHATRIMFVFDEAKTIPAPTWDALEGAYTTEGLSEDHMALAFAISTPGEPSGRFYDIHMQGAGYEDWTVKHVTIDEAIAAGRVSAKWVEQRRKQWGEDSVVFQNRVLGEFADTSEDGVIPLSWVNAAVARWHERKKEDRLYEGHPATIGVDVARHGDDATVVARRYGSTLSNLHEYRKNSVTVTAGIILQHLGGSYATIDGDAYGSSVYDILYEQGHRNLTTLIAGGRTSFRDKSGKLSFLNNRSAMWWNMRELLDPRNQEGIALPPVQRIIGDLVAPQWKTNSRGVIQVEGKEAIRKRIGRSTDYGDAVCLAFWKATRGGGIVF